MENQKNESLNEYLNENNWEFVYETPTDEYPLGYYLYKPKQEKYCFKTGIQDFVDEKTELRIYNMWWLNNG